MKRCFNEPCDDCNSIKVLAAMDIYNSPPERNTIFVLRSNEWTYHEREISFQGFRDEKRWSRCMGWICGFLGRCYRPCEWMRKVK